MKRIAVLGGGIAGLAAAHKLHELTSSASLPERPEILLLEGASRLGGVICTEKVEGCLLERGPDSIMTQKPWALDLCRRLGIDRLLIKTDERFRRTFVAFKEVLHPVPEGFIMLAPTQWWPFVSSPLFSPLGKLRMAMDLVLPRARNNTDESLASFVRRRLGREALERMAQPMVGGVYTADPDKLSLRATMPRFLDLEEKYGSVIKGITEEQRKGTANGGNSNDSGARYSLFVSFGDGIQVLVDALASKLPPPSVRLGATVSRLVPGADGTRWSVQLANGESIAADGVIVALPAYSAAGILQSADQELSNQLRKIEYASSAVLNLVYERASIDHPLDGFGFVVPATESLSLMACSFSSVKYSGRAPAGKVLLRAFLGGALKPRLLELSDEELVAAVAGDLKKLLGVKGKPLQTQLTRWPRSMPQYHVGHLGIVEAVDKRLLELPGLALAGNAYRGVGIPDCVRSGEQAAQAVFSLVCRCS